MERASHLFRKLPLFASHPNLDTLLHGALIEAQTFQKTFQSTRLEIFPRSSNLKEEKYIEIIPFAWAACNALRTKPLPAEILVEMMTVSLLNFQADEYFESITTESNAVVLRVLVNYACGIAGSADRLPGEGVLTDAEFSSALSDDVEDGFNPSCRDILDTLTKFAHRILHHPSVTSAPESVRSEVRKSLAEYMQAQITSTINRSSSSRSRTQGTSLFNWVRSIGSDDTSCPYSFAYFMALSSHVLAMRQVDTSRGYLQKALCRHLATICRMYNDYGSLSRDREEGNLNCIDFLLEDNDDGSVDTETMPPLSSTGDGDRVRDVEDRRGERIVVREDTATEAAAAYVKKQTGERTKTDTKAKAALMNLAQYERDCMELTLARLKKAGLEGGMLEAVLLFIDVTDLFGQIYVVRDIGTRTK